MGDLASGDERAPQTVESLNQILYAYRAHLPGIMEAYNKTIAPSEQALFDARKALSPQESELEKQKTIQERSLLEGEGGNLVRSAHALDMEIDPEYYSGRAIAGSKLSDLLGGMDPNKLTGVEMANVERGLNRLNNSTGNIVPNRTNTLANALSFDDRLQQKRSGVTNAINAATQFLPQARSGVDALNQATGRSVRNTPQTTPFGSTAANIAGNVFGSASQLEQGGRDINANRRTAADHLNQTMEATTSNKCCFIFLEAYNGELPFWVRECRDEYYVKEPLVAKGYIRMAKWLVPLMKKFPLIRQLINDIMIIPLTAYGGWQKNVYGYKDGKVRYEGYKKFWFKVWKMIGKKGDI